MLPEMLALPQATTSLVHSRHSWVIRGSFWLKVNWGDCPIWEDKTLYRLLTHSFLVTEQGACEEVSL